MRRLLLVLVALGMVGAALFGLGYWNARADPLVRRTYLALPGWPRGQAPVRIALISDIHIGSSAMGPKRLSRIVGQIDALSPDLVLIAGDFVFGHDPVAAKISAQELTMPLARLHAPLGVIATLGNHDQWTQPRLIREMLERAGITVLENQAVARGPLAIGGAGDLFSGHADLPGTLKEMRGLKGARIMVTHSPDLARRLPADVLLLFAGHTHCGQVVLPLIGPVSQVAAPRYQCGMIREGARTTIVTGGLGTSGVPLRFGAPPDLWLVTVGPSRSRS